MYQKILVAIDGSEHSKRALKQAVQLTKNLQTTSALTIFHVNQNVPVVDPTVSEEVNIEELINEEGGKILKLAEALLAGAEVKYTPRTVFGDPAEEITKAAKDYDLIIMGSRGLNAISEIVLGSVSHKVIKHATCPVLIVK
ncbi:universal stress protein [Neobacillus sp. SM06]|uniref:universal stress protein n=1 Tax=Neobacillus sp. SM06 TaxID=3422492 RepID=UPI003D2C028A